jgi:hypothetical protein
VDEGTLEIHPGNWTSTLQIAFSRQPTRTLCIGLKSIGLDSHQNLDIHLEGLAIATLEATLDIHPTNEVSGQPTSNRSLPITPNHAFTLQTASLPDSCSFDRSTMINIAHARSYEPKI